MFFMRLVSITLCLAVLLSSCRYVLRLPLGLRLRISNVPIAVKYTVRHKKHTKIYQS